MSEYGGECLVEVLTAIGREPSRAVRSQRVAVTSPLRKIEILPSSRRGRPGAHSTSCAVQTNGGNCIRSSWREQRFYLKQALFYAADEILAQPYRLFGDQIDIQFSPGVLRALIA